MSLICFYHFSVLLSHSAVLLSICPPFIPLGNLADWLWQPVNATLPLWGLMASCLNQMRIIFHLQMRESWLGPDFGSTTLLHHAFSFLIIARAPIYPHATLSFANKHQQNRRTHECTRMHVHTLAARLSPSLICMAMPLSGCEVSRWSGWQCGWQQVYLKAQRKVGKNGVDSLPPLFFPLHL